MTYDKFRFSFTLGGIICFYFVGAIANSRYIEFEGHKRLITVDLLKTSLDHLVKDEAFTSVAKLATNIISSENGRNFDSSEIW